MLLLRLWRTRFPLTTSILPMTVWTQPSCCNRVVRLPTVRAKSRVIHYIPHMPVHSWSKRFGSFRGILDSKSTWSNGIVSLCKYAWPLNFSRIRGFSLSCLSNSTASNHSVLSSEFFRSSHSRVDLNGHPIQADFGGLGYPLSWHHFRQSSRVTLISTNGYSFLIHENSGSLIL